MYVNLFFLFILSIIGLCYLPPARDRVHGEYPFLGEGNSSFLKGHQEGKTFLVSLYVRLNFTSLLCRLNESIIYTARTGVRLFVSLKGQSGGH